MSDTDIEESNSDRFGLFKISNSLIWLPKKLNIFLEYLAIFLKFTLNSEKVGYGKGRIGI